MALLQIVVAEATTNLITNPSFETNTTGWTAVGTGTTLARSTSYQRFGVYSLEVTPGSGVNDGVYHALTLSASTQYTFNIYVRGANGIPYRLRAYDVTGATDLATSEFTGDGNWGRQEVTFTTGSNTSIRLYVEKNNSSDTSAFYIDGAQCEAKGYSTTFCDGDQDGCEWSGEEHASTSSRDARSRAGGRVYDLGDATLHVTSLFGAGMPPIRQISQDQPLLPGELYQRTKVQPRVLTFTFVASVAGDTSTFHSARSTLISYLKPDDVI